MISLGITTRKVVEVQHAISWSQSGIKICKVQLGPSGEVGKYKARNVMKSFKQVDGLDFFKYLAPIRNPETIRILLQLSA